MSHPSETGRRGLAIKAYVVMQRHNLVPEGMDNVTVHAVLLTRAAAQAVVNRLPGTFIERHIATK